MYAHLGMTRFENFKSGTLLHSIKGIEDIASTDISPTQIMDIAVLKKVADGVTDTELSVPERNFMKIFQKQLSKIENIQQKMDAIRSKPTISPAERSQLQVYDARLSSLNKQLLNIAHVDLLTDVTQRAKRELIEKYGSIDVGEKPSRAVSIPKRTPKDNCFMLIFFMARLLLCHCFLSYSRLLFFPFRQESYDG